MFRFLTRWFNRQPRGLCDRDERLMGVLLYSVRYTRSVSDVRRPVLDGWRYHSSQVWERRTSATGGVGFVWAKRPTPHHPGTDADLRATLWRRLNDLAIVVMERKIHVTQWISVVHCLIIVIIIIWILKYLFSSKSARQTHYT